MRFAVRFRDPTRPDRWSALTPSAKQPGRWQLTWFDADGPGGDSIRDTIGELLELAAWDRLEIDAYTGPDAAAGEALVSAAAARLAQAHADLMAEIDALTLDTAA